MTPTSRCSEERRDFYDYVQECADFTLKEILEWDAELHPHLCEGWERFGTITYGGRGTLGLCWELQPLAEFRVECGPAWIKRGTRPNLCDYYDHRLQLAVPGDRPSDIEIGFYRGAHEAHAILKHLCWEKWPL